MSNPEVLDISLADVSCRILIVSSSLEQATTFIRRVQDLGNISPPSQTPTTSISTANAPLNLSDLSKSLIKIPWTITNRYYTANVHFAAHTMHGLSPHQVKNIPAIIFVWGQGEEYKHHIERLSQDLSGYEPEVSLAVRTRRVNDSPEEQTEEDEDDNDIDGFLSSHGFEYIDATVGRPSRASPDDEGEGPFSDVIPSLPRVLDALSTIMWPSMEARVGSSSKIRDARQRERGLLDWAQNSSDNSLSAVEDLVIDSSTTLASVSRNRKREMQELARWLEEDETLRGDPWKSAANSGISASPTALEDLSSFGKTLVREPDGASAGFDDDFTFFVSAPAPASKVDESGRSTPDGSPLRSLAPPHAGDLYRSLGSVSDLGDGDEDGKVEPMSRGSDDKKDTSDDDLPTEEEVRAASSRIFGTGTVQPPPLSRTQTAKPTSNSPTPPSTHKSITDTFSFDSFPTDLIPEDGDDDDYDMAPFDLSRVLSALQEMKAEIAGMEDEGERRKAAAKVALGLVYGLEADAGLDPDAQLRGGL